MIYEIVFWWLMSTLAPIDDGHRYGPTQEWDCIVNIKPIHYPHLIDNKGGKWR